MTDTIFAVSSGAAPAAIAVMRLSGADAARIGVAVAGALPEPRLAGLRRLRDASGATLDRALVLWFPGPATATGEDLVEFHLHGGRAVIAAVERAIVSQGARRAEPGEFTRRALLAGRIDVAQATGLADLLAAETETARRSAMALTEGAFSRDVRRWLATISDARARIEAAIDYDDEGDVTADPVGVDRAVADMLGEIDARLSAPTVEAASGGVRVVLAGPPNAGKSSLLNALVERDAAIVAPIAGTTRDRIEVVVHRADHTYTIVDTAGLAEATADPIEAAGIARAREAMDAADIVLWLGDAPPPAGEAVVALHPRCDEAGRGSGAAGRLAVSVLRPDTIVAVWDAIAARAGGLLVLDEGYRIHDRQRAILADAAAECREAAGLCDPILKAEMLRRASARLGRLLGIDETEAMLDALFSRFCVGK